jgi:hypothetical protein
MAITTYTELQTSVENWLHRGDLTALIPDFITLAEVKLSADLEARAMETRATLTTVANNAYLALPTDLLEVRRLIINGSTVKPLEFASPDQLSRDHANGVSGKPSVFTVIGSNLQFGPTPDAAYTLELTYRQKIPALSDSSTTNWLLTAYPNAYLYGALCAAQPYLMNDARLGTFQALYQEAVAGINRIDWYTGSTMRVRAG